MPNEGTQIYLLKPSSRGILPSYNEKQQSMWLRRSSRDGQMAFNRLLVVSFKVFEARGGLQKLSEVLVILPTFTEIFTLCRLYLVTQFKTVREAVIYIGSPKLFTVLV